MRAWIRTNRILLQIAFRNLFASKARTLIVGGIVLGGALILVVLGTLAGTIQRGMSGSIRGSLAGDLQVYAARSRDALALYGGMMGESQLEPIEDFAAVKRVLERVPNVRAVVPMGIDQAMVSTGNELDVVLERLRDDVRRRQAGDASPELARRYQAHKAHVRRMATQLRAELKQAAVIVDEALLRDRARDRDDLARATSDGFWDGFDADPLAGLEFLENRVAPQSYSGGFTFIRYAGTDLDAYQRAFDRMRVVQGTAVPPGHRGLLIGQLYAEDWLKLKVARRLDRIRDARQQRRWLFWHRSIDSDEELARWVKENQGQTREILLQLDDLRAAEATARLQRALGTAEPDLQKLLVQLFTTDDAGFDRRYAIFYEQLAPLLQLYTVRVGDTITIKAPSKSGYMSSVSLPVYGFIEFRGLEKSSLAGVMSLMDLVSWRDLYGYMTPEKAAEIRAIKASVGVRDVSRENADAELFGGGAATEAPAATRVGRVEAPDLSGTVARRRAEVGQAAAAFGPEAIDAGVALNAALLLEDPSRSAETAAAVRAALAGAGLDLKVVDWKAASGPIVGGLVDLVGIILTVAILIIFVVALVIINNAVVMATLQRVKEIGTLRALGAQKRFVLVMLLLETTAIGLAFGVAGALLGAGVIQALRALGGIPAWNDQLYFFFSGPSLVPQLTAGSLLASLVVVLVVSVLSGLYPAILASRVTPLEAMQSDE